MIALTDIKSKQTLMKNQYAIADKLLKHINEHGNIELEIDNATRRQIDGTYALLQELKLVRNIRVRLDSTLPPHWELQLTADGNTALYLGVERFLKRNNRLRTLLIVAFIVLFISSVAGPIITLIK